MKKLILNSFISSIIFFWVWFFVMKWMAALSNVTSWTPLTSSLWNNMISNFIWQTNWTTISYMSGNVWIWTTTPSVTLDVNGKIKMQNQTVSWDSADIVATKWYVDSKFNLGGMDCQRIDYATTITINTRGTQTCPEWYKIFSASCDSDTSYRGVSLSFVWDNAVKCLQKYSSWSAPVAFHYVCCK